MDKTYADYLSEVGKYRLAHPEQRRGQAYMNVLSRFRPDMYKLIVSLGQSGTNADPFYNDDNMNAFFEVLERNW